MFFLNKESKSKKKKKNIFVPEMAGGGGGVHRQTDEQAKTILPLLLFRSRGHNNA